MSFECGTSSNCFLEGESNEVKRRMALGAIHGMEAPLGSWLEPVNKE
jgi:hypothetical protein